MRSATWGLFSKGCVCVQVVLPHSRLLKRTESCSQAQAQTALNILLLHFHYPAKREKTALSLERRENVSGRFICCFQWRLMLMVKESLQECLNTQEAEGGWTENPPFQARSVRRTQGYLNMESTNVDPRRKAEGRLQARRKCWKGDWVREQNQSLPYPEYRSGCSHLKIHLYTCAPPPEWLKNLICKLTKGHITTLSHCEHMDNPMFIDDVCWLKLFLKQYMKVLTSRTCLAVLCYLSHVDDGCGSSLQAVSLGLGFLTVLLNYVIIIWFNWEVNSVLLKQLSDFTLVAKSLNFYFSCSTYVYLN